MTALAPTTATTSIALSKGTIALGIAAAVGLIVVSAVIGGVVLSRDARRGRSVTIEATNDGDSSALRLGSTSVDDSGPRHLGLAITSTSTTLTAPETPTPPAQPTTPEAPTLTPPETPTTLTPPATPETPETPTPTVQTTSPSGREERPPPRDKQRLEVEAQAAPAEAVVPRGTLMIAPEPRTAGWRVSVDGTFAIETPRSVPLDAGAHRLEFTAPGFGTITRIVEVKGGAETFAERLVP